MNPDTKVFTVLPAAGTGTRFGAEKPKQVFFIYFMALKIIEFVSPLSKIKSEDTRF